jgi:hypothetical protein
MVKDSILLYGSAGEAELANDIKEMFFTRNLKHYASCLLLNALHDESELEAAVQKAFTACLVAGLPVQRHFKHIFVCAGEIKEDWLVSGLAIQLIVLNADVSNPLVAKLQVGILSDKMGSFYR